MRSRLFGWIVALVGSLMAAPSLAEVLQPDPELSPAEVIAIQLSALQANDTPERDAGIAQTFAFAHPDNKRVTGPLPRFAQMIKGRAIRSCSTTARTRSTRSSATTIRRPSR